MLKTRGLEGAKCRGLEILKSRKSSGLIHIKNREKLPLSLLQARWTPDERRIKLNESH